MWAREERQLLGLCFWGLVCSREVVLLGSIVEFDTVILVAIMENVMYCSRNLESIALSTKPHC